MSTHLLLKDVREDDCPGPHLNDQVCEYYRTVLSRMRGCGSGASERVRTVGVTSCYSGEGVSTVAAQLAVTAASCGHGQVLLVDSNFGRPSAGDTFGLEPGPGWGEVLMHGKEPLSQIRPSFVTNLSVLAAGELNGQATRALDDGTLSNAIDALKAQFDLVVFDMPAADRLGFLVRLAGLVDGVLLVVEAERVRWEVARRAIEQLTRDDVRLLGAVLNKRLQHVPNWLYQTL